MLHDELRPKTFKACIGQSTAIQTLQSIDQQNFPHCILFTGPSGTGKTTLARICAKTLGARAGLREVNAAQSRGIDFVRDLNKEVHLPPLDGGPRVIILDEAQSLTKEAQNALLKLLEEPPANVYFMLVTTEPEKLLKTVKSRCLKVTCNPLSDKEIGKLVDKVCKSKKISLGEDVKETIIDVSDGCAREALNLIESVMRIEDEDLQLEALLAFTGSDGGTQSITLARALLNPRGNWVDVRNVLKELDVEPESVRYMILAYCTTIVLKGGKVASKAIRVIESFEDSFIHSKKAGLVAACWRVYND